MFADVGLLALVLAFLSALVLGSLPLLGAQLGEMRLMRIAGSAALAQLVFVGLAFVILALAFVHSDFSLAYVANHSNTLLPLQYRLSAVWGGHEGSMLLWVLILSLWTLAVVIFGRRLPAPMLARVAGVMGLVGVGFIAFLLFTSSPFETLWPVPPEGRDLNPMLQDPGLIIHPPILYTGYVGFSVAFAFAIAALLEGRLDAAWARWVRPWTTIAWVFLTLGIGLGSWWAYYVLGWGGWWFWDPVENASFMPWLAGTALIHSLAVTEKRGAFLNWTVLLAILTFALVLVGAFLVRSGVLTSVHAFAVDPERGLFVLLLLGIVVGASLLLFALRAPRVGVGGGFKPVSREAALLGNNLILVVTAAAVLLGTLYPLLLESLGMGRISVGPPYFEAIFVPLMLMLLLLLALGAGLRWKQDRMLARLAGLRWMLLLGLVGGLLWPLALGEWSPLAAAGCVLALWVLFSGTRELWRRVRPVAPGGAWRRPSAALLGMQLAHAGLAVIVIGITFVSGYEQERDVRLAVGESAEVAGYRFSMVELAEVTGPNYVADRATVEVYQGEQLLSRLYPEMRRYFSQAQPMAHTSLDRGWLRDLYVNLGEPLPDGAWILRLYYKPYMNWVWTAAVMMGLGGLLAVADRRYRLRRRAKQPLPGVRQLLGELR